MSPRYGSAALQILEKHQQNQPFLYSVLSFYVTRSDETL